MRANRGYFIKVSAGSVDVTEMSAFQETPTRPFANAIGTASAEEILARLELYVSRSRDPSREAFVARESRSDTLLPSTRGAGPPCVAHGVQPRSVVRSTIDLLPYELVLSAMGCAATIIAYALLARPLALAMTLALAATGECLRRMRWWPPAGMSLTFGTVVGVLVVFTA
jgi:hypothetical protein